MSEEIKKVSTKDVSENNVVQDNDENAQQNSMIDEFFSQSQFTGFKSFQDDSKDDNLSSKVSKGAKPGVKSSSKISAKAKGPSSSEALADSLGVKSNPNASKTPLRGGFVSVIGLPNAGKSTLVNRIIGEQVSIVSPKAQTTRQCVTGIYTNESAQIVFVDAPGFIQAETGLNHFIQRQWEESVKDCDVALGVLNIDCDTEDKISNAILTLASINKPKFAYINKVDLVKYAERLFIIEQKLRDQNIPFVFGSAKSASKENIDTLIANLIERLPETDQFLYDKSLYTLQTEKEIAAEVIREKCFNMLGQEVPYQTGVHIIAFEEDPKCVKIYADIWISKERYKKIVVGQKGLKIQDIGTEARKDLERILGVKVYLSLKVKLKESWTKNSNMLKEIGYELRK